MSNVLNLSLTKTSRLVSRALVILLFAEGYAKGGEASQARSRRRNPGCDFTESQELSGFLRFFLNRF